MTTQYIHLFSIPEFGETGQPLHPISRASAFVSDSFALLLRILPDQLWDIETLAGWIHRDFRTVAAVRTSKGGPRATSWEIQTRKKRIIREFVYGDPRRYFRADRPSPVSTEVKKHAKSRVPLQGNQCSLWSLVSITDSNDANWVTGSMGRSSPCCREVSKSNVMKIWPYFVLGADLDGFRAISFLQEILQMSPWLEVTYSRFWLLC